MPFQILRNDITTMAVDAIVCAGNRFLEGGGGVDDAIRRAAGPELADACARLGGCKTGQAKITPGFRLKSRYVIHTAGPVWHGGFLGEREKLASCYRSCLDLAQEQGCESIAFPLISSGTYRFPKDLALRIALDTISAYLMEQEITVYLVIYDKAAFRASSRIFADIQSYIDDQYVEERHRFSPRQLREDAAERLFPGEDSGGAPPAPESAFRDVRHKSKARGLPFLPDIPRPSKVPDSPPAEAPQKCAAPSPLPKASENRDFVCEGSLERYAAPFGNFPQAQAINIPVVLDESFSQMLLRKIDEKGIKDSQCYKKANISRKLFSKIRSDPHYRPSKPTVLAFAISLELPLEETKELMMKAGFALSKSYTFDIIVEYFITRGIYDIYTINEALFAFDQSLLGG